jgi:tripartite-type tricarboxylate transporter receptor subunit TctC
MKELIAYARANPGKLSYASANAAGQVSSALFAQMAGLDILPVPYKTSTNALTDTLAGTVSLMFTDIPPSLGHVRAGKLRALTVMSKNRFEALPEVPTALESGYPALGNVLEWYGVVVPAATPRDTVAKLNASIVRALNAAGCETSYVNIETDKGHDAIFLEEPALDSALRGFLASAAEKRGLS